ncbi:isochorismate synthase MenF [Paenisporosarcina sp. TG20]|uniref:isochorismate synthase n=1 Tax=Paenisporosarcina sp. TG20 TaxID=1211706 RepID=UPI00031CB86D|nr:isochorismate synthase [Paenisporosarcina sp. TG20]
MIRKSFTSTEQAVQELPLDVHFYTETIEMSRLSSIAFFEAGELYKGKRFYWQNREKTFTLVGLGHAHVITSSLEHKRFEDVDKQWKELCYKIVNEEHELQPILFGGFSFDPINKLSSEWDMFPSAYFAVPSFQLVIRDDRVFISIHLITNEKDSQNRFDQMRTERDTLIHTAQVKELKTYAKPHISTMEERFKELYMDAVSHVTKLIHTGEAQKVVIARSLALTFTEKVSSPSAIYHVSKEQPESFVFGLELADNLFFGATPERLVKVENKRALSTCLAGSVKRGQTAIEDQQLGYDLLHDAKNREEHQYVVDMITDVFTRYCDDVKVPKYPKLMKIRDIQHLYTPVEGQLQKEQGLLNLVKDLHPTPALGGEPRGDAMAIIRMVEQMNRGYYASPVGWIDAVGNGEFAVAIRSALLNKQNAYLYAGGGIVAESDPISEYAETLVKFRPMLRTLGGKLNG